MQQITLQTQSIPKPAGIVVGGWNISLRNAGGDVTHNYTGALPETTFMEVATGLYTISAARVSGNGDPIAPPVTREFQVDGDTVDVPVAILVGGA